MSGVDPVKSARFIGELTGKQGLVEEILSGRMSADDILPLVAGMVDMMVCEVAGPIIQVQDWTGFDPTARPMEGIITIPNGKVKITLEALDG